MHTLVRGNSFPRLKGRLRSAENGVQWWSWILDAQWFLGHWRYFAADPDRIGGSRHWKATVEELLKFILPSLVGALWMMLFAGRRLEGAPIISLSNRCEGLVQAVFVLLFSHGDLFQNNWYVRSADGVSIV